MRISVMKAAVEKAKLGQAERLAALKWLDDEAPGSPRRAPVEDMIAEERRLSHAYGGHGAFGWEPLR
jgi:hypothetical protein